MNDLKTVFGFSDRVGILSSSTALFTMYYWFGQNKELYMDSVYNMLERCLKKDKTCLLKRKPSHLFVG